MSSLLVIFVYQPWVNVYPVHKICSTHVAKSVNRSILEKSRHSVSLQLIRPWPQVSSIHHLFWDTYCIGECNEGAQGGHTVFSLPSKESGSVSAVPSGDREKEMSWTKESSLGYSLLVLPICSLFIFTTKETVEWRGKVTRWARARRIVGVDVYWTSVPTLK